MQLDAEDEGQPFFNKSPADPDSKAPDPIQTAAEAGETQAESAATTTAEQEE